MHKHYFKPLSDISCAILALFVLSPLLFLITIGLWFANYGKPFFYQSRPGKNGKLFKIIKFKTMNDKKDAKGNLLPDEFRLTKIGQFVRKTSLDEVPQLLNVIKGEMSIVGPRPLLPEYLPLYSQMQSRRHDAKPGITGWAQVNGRNAISWQQKFEFDVWYVDNLSFLLDLKIVFLTIKKVIIKEGINSQGQITTQAFQGN